MPTPPVRGTRRLRRAAIVAAIAMVVGACSGDGGNGDAGSTTEAADGVALFDSSAVHQIEVDFDEAEYDAMIETYGDSGEKEWIEADVSIDGTTYERAGLRLKGNSSLMGIGQGTPDETTTTAAEDSTTTAAEDSTTTAAEDPPADDGEGAGRGGPAGGASADDPSSLPWLIRLDEFVEGQDHQGYEDIVVRSNGSETALNEAVALELLEEASLPSQQAAATAFSVNGSDPVLRLAIEHPDDDAWQEANFDSEGALYKAESSGGWDYLGDDPAEYEEVFDQEGGKDVTDLTPLIEFLQFINESDDETFAAELEERLDVESFATYLAAMELLGNFDDIDGPGNNAYLWWDAESEQFTIVPWDLNLALGGSENMGGGGGPGGFQPPGDGEMPEGFEPPADGEMPEGVEPPAGGGAGGGGGRGFGGENILVERFHDNETFEAMYQEKLDELGESLYESDVAQEILDRWVDVLKSEASDLVDEETIDEEAESISSQLTVS